MIKATFDSKTGHTLLLGLSRENITRLMADQPIRILPDADLGLPITLVIMGGETEQEIYDQLSPLFGPHTITHGVSRETED